MNIAALMGASGTPAELNGSSNSTASGLNEEFKKVLQVLATSIDEQSTLANTALTADEKSNWVGSLLKLFDQNSALQAIPQAAQGEPQSEQEAASVSLTEIMTTLQTMVNQNDAETLIDASLVDQPASDAASDVVSKEADSAEIEPADLINQSQIVSPGPVKITQSLSDLSTTLTNSSTANQPDAASLTAASKGTVPVTAAQPEAVFVEEGNSQSKAQANGATSATESGTKTAAASAKAATLPAVSSSTNHSFQTMAESYQSTATAAPAANSDGKAQAQTAAPGTPASSSGQAEALVDATKTSASTRPASATSESTDSDTTEAASPSVSASVSRSVQNGASAKAAGNVSLPNVPALNQITESIKLITQHGETQVRLQLHPEELGQVLVQLHINDGKVSVSMLAETMQAQALIQDHLPQLKAALANQGLQIHQANINVGSDASAFDRPHHQSNDANFNGGRYQHGKRSVFEDGIAPSVHVGTGMISGLYAVDYQV